MLVTAGLDSVLLLVEQEMFVKFQLVGEKILLVLLLAGMKRFAEILLAGK